MAYISSFVFCDQIKNEPGPNGPVRNIVSPLSEIKPVSIPGNYTFSIACIINDFNVEINNSILIKITDPKGREKTVFDATIPSAPKEIFPQGVVPTSVNVDLDLRNIVLLEEGNYKVKIFLNDELLTTQDLKVSVGEIL